jgi:hypothetical protein
MTAAIAVVRSALVRISLALLETQYTRFSRLINRASSAEAIPGPRLASDFFAV